MDLQKISATGSFGIGCAFGAAVVYLIGLAYQVSNHGQEQIDSAAKAAQNDKPVQSLTEKNVQKIENSSFSGLQVAAIASATAVFTAAATFYATFHYVAAIYEIILVASQNIGY